MLKRSIYPIVFLVLVANLFGSGPVAAGGPPPKVQSAIPNEAEQGQDGFPVKIKGQNFGTGAWVRFLVAGSDDDTQIDVVSVSYDPDTGDLDTVIDVKDTAILSSYDIEVYSGGRRGKGTDLFKVLEKGSSGGTANSELSANFYLFLEDFTPGLSHDGQPVYEDSKKAKVKVGTGSGPGFRFDTNTSKNSPQRTVGINFPGGSVNIKDNDGVVIDTLYSAQYNIDLRFNKTSPTEGLDIGAMDIGEVAYVPIDMSFNPLEGSNSYGLAWGVDSMPFSHGYLANNPCIANYGLNAQVERLTVGSWRIRSNPADANACLWFINHESLDGNQDGTVVSMPFDFTIEIK